MHIRNNRGPHRRQAPEQSILPGQATVLQRQEGAYLRVHALVLDAHLSRERLHFQLLCDSVHTASARRQCPNSMT